MKATTFPKTVQARCQLFSFKSYLSLLRSTLRKTPEYDDLIIKKDATILEKINSYWSFY